MQDTATQLEQSAVDAIVDGLTQGLSETVVTTMKAQNYHWNVTGMAFGPLHDLFQKIYEDHFAGAGRAWPSASRRWTGMPLGTSLRAMLEPRQCGRVSTGISLDAEEDGRQSWLADQETSGRHDTPRSPRWPRSMAIKPDARTWPLPAASVHEKFAWFLRAHLK